MAVNIPDKVLRYETFLNETLKEDLKTLENQLKEVNETLSNWYLLLETISNIRDHHSKGFKTKVDLGNEIYCKVKVSDPSVINVNIGLNVYLQMTLDEAIDFCNYKIKFLNKAVETIQKKSVDVKAHIKIVLLGLKELQKM